MGQWAARKSNSQARYACRKYKSTAKLFHRAGGGQLPAARKLLPPSSCWSDARFRRVTLESGRFVASFDTCTIRCDNDTIYGEIAEPQPITNEPTASVTWPCFARFSIGFPSSQFLLNSANDSCRYRSRFCLDAVDFTVASAISSRWNSLPLPASRCSYIPKLLMVNVIAGNLAFPRCASVFYCIYIRSMFFSLKRNSLPRGT